MIQIKSKILNKTALIVVSIFGFLASAVAHGGEETTKGTTTGMMMGSSWMHTGADMMGYNMWGMGWFGLLFGLAFWILIILGIIYLYQQVTENKGDEE